MDTGWVSPASISTSTPGHLRGSQRQPHWLGWKQPGSLGAGTWALSRCERFENIQAAQSLFAKGAFLQNELLHHQKRMQAGRKVATGKEEESQTKRQKHS